MIVPLLETKLYVPPVRPNLVSRPHLIERLNQGVRLGCKLTLVSAPAGFGKTTLLSEWVRQVQRPVAWLSLDGGDDDANRFWRYAIAALQTVDATIGKTIQSALESPQLPPLDTLVTVLINDLVAHSAPLILVLDDYHVIEAEPVHSSLNFFLDHLPSHLHLALATRTDPPLSLSRRRARSELSEMRAVDLCFAAREVTELFNAVMGLDLSAKDIAALEDRTEGWVVGLQMAALSLQGKAPARKHDLVSAFAGNDRYVADYLMDEVLQGQPSHIQAFLMQTSILERLCGPLCDAVTGRNDSQEILRCLEQTNLFTIPLDNQRHWYRYHQLFADLLHQRLRLSKGAEGVAALYLRASEWYEGKGFISDAVSCALDAPDLAYAANLIERHVLTTFYRSEIGLVHSWIRALPESLLCAHPLLCAVYAATIWHSPPYPPDSTRLAERWLQRAEEALAAQSCIVATSGPLGRSVNCIAACFIAMFRAFLARFRGDDPQTIIDLSQNALDGLPKEGSASIGDNYMRFRSALTFNLGMAYDRLGDEKAASRTFAQARQLAQECGDFFNACAAAYMQTEAARKHGQLRQAAALCQDAMDSIARSGGSSRAIPFAGALYIALGRVLLEWNDLEKAHCMLTRGLELIKLVPMVNIQTTGYLALARLKQARGDLMGALELIEQAERLQPENVAQAAAYRVRFWLAQADQDADYLAASVRWAQERQIELDDGERSDEERLALVRLLVAQRRARPFSGQLDLQPLLHYLERQFDVADRIGNTERAIEVLVLQAMALQAQGDTPQALAALQRALALTEPEGFIRLFVDEGRHMATLLCEAAIHGIAPSYVDKLLASFESLKRERVETASPGSRAQPLVEPLTRRELEVLRFIATGASNREIAEALVIAVNTLKKHITSIYGKLGVNNRTQAVIRARELGLTE